MPIRAPSCRWCLIALGGEIELRSQRQSRRVAAETFFTGMMSTDCAIDELIEAVRFPTARAGAGYAFREIGDGMAILPSSPAPQWWMHERRRLAVGGVADRPTARDLPLPGDPALDDALDAFAVGPRRPRRSACHRRYRRHLVRGSAGRRLRRPLDAALERQARSTACASRSTADRLPARREPRMLLSDFMRHVIGATGTHVGCEHGVCGACTVQIDGAPARSCLTLAVQAEGADIRTVEGLAPAPDRLSALQEAFRDSYALAMRLLHAGHPDVARCVVCASGRMPSEPEIREFLSRPSVPLHRLWPIVRAALEAARQAARGKRPCLISAPALWRASSAIPKALAIVDGDVRLTYRAMVRQDFLARRRLRRTRSQARRSSRHRAAESLGGGDHPLGLPVRRHHHHADELAREGRRNRFLHRECRSHARSFTRTFRPPH